MFPSPPRCLKIGNEVRHSSTPQEYAPWDKVGERVIIIDDRSTFRGKVEGTRIIHSLVVSNMGRTRHGEVPEADACGRP